jgi:hypothetical protein
MMSLNQITATEWNVTDQRARVLATFKADNETDAMSFVAHAYPACPCELNVHDYEAGVAAVLEAIGIAA